MKIGFELVGGTVRPLKREPHSAEWGRSATVTDPDGHCVLLMEKPMIVHNKA